MNTKSLVAAVFAMVAASGAFAQFNGEATYEYPVASGSATTREAVKAEYIAARDGGQIPNGEAAYRVDPSQSSTSYALSREAVKAEVVAANARGELNAFNGEATYERPQPSMTAHTRDVDDTMAATRSQRGAN